MESNIVTEITGSLGSDGDNVPSNETPQAFLPPELLLVVAEQLGRSKKNRKTIANLMMANKNCHDLVVAVLIRDLTIDAATFTVDKLRAFIGPTTALQPNQLSKFRHVKSLDLRFDAAPHLEARLLRLCAHGSLEKLRYSASHASHHELVFGHPDDWPLLKQLILFARQTRSSYEVASLAQQVTRLAWDPAYRPPPSLKRLELAIQEQRGLPVSDMLATFEECASLEEWEDMSPWFPPERPLDKYPNLASKLTGIGLLASHMKDLQKSNLPKLRRLAVYLILADRALPELLNGLQIEQLTLMVSNSSTILGGLPAGLKVFEMIGARPTLELDSFESARKAIMDAKLERFVVRFFAAHRMGGREEADLTAREEAFWKSVHGVEWLE